MRSVTVIVLLVCVEQAHAKDSTDEYVDKTVGNFFDRVTDKHVSSDKWVDKMVNKLFYKVVDRALNMQHLHGRDVENTTLALTPRSTPYRRSFVPRNPAFPQSKRFFPWSMAARRSARVQASIVQPEVVEAAKKALSEATPWITQALQVYLGVTIIRSLMSPGGRTAPEDIRGDEKIMSQKAHGTCPKPVQNDLRWGCERDGRQNLRL